MKEGRHIDLGRLISERRILKQHVERKEEFDTEVSMIAKNDTYQHLISQNILGVFRPHDARKAVIADMGLLNDFAENGLKIPSFREAGPRDSLRHDPKTEVRAAIVTTGGLAPGLHCVIHSIVMRHHNYQIAHGKVFGVYNSYRGLCNLKNNLIELNKDMTEEWLDQGGSKLGIVRYYHGEEEGDKAIQKMVEVISENLEHCNIHILYVIGGDGSLKVAHQIAKANPTRSIVGIPKTMDNDVLWVWQSFGFNTAVEQATRVINTLRTEAEATRRIGVIQLFGADSGFVAANASLASGHVDLVLIPEVFLPLSEDEVHQYLEKVIKHVEDKVRGRNTSELRNPHAVVVIAEGVEIVLAKKKDGVFIEGQKVEKGNFVSLFTKAIREKVRIASGQSFPVFVNEPRHYIRSLPANPHDQIYCERLGALAVDNALAGYTDFMISQWLTEFVLVPLSLVELGQKRIPVKGMFWKQVVSSTEQPLSAAEIVED